MLPNHFGSNRFRTVSDRFGIVSDRFPIVFGRLRWSKQKKTKSIGQGWGPSWADPSHPAPALTNWNLNFWNSSYFIVWKRLSDDHPTAVHWSSDDHPSNAQHEQIQLKTKCVLNDRSRHDDEFCPKIVKIGAILNYFWSLQRFAFTQVNFAKGG